MLTFAYGTPGFLNNWKTWKCDRFKIHMNCQCFRANGPFHKGINGDHPCQEIAISRVHQTLGTAANERREYKSSKLWILAGDFPKSKTCCLHTFPICAVSEFYALSYFCLGSPMFFNTFVLSRNIKNSPRILGFLRLRVFHKMTLPVLNVAETATRSTLSKTLFFEKSVLERRLIFRWGNISICDDCTVNT